MQIPPVTATSSLETLAEEPGGIKFMTYNIERGGTEHPGWETVIKEESPDIITFVETEDWDTSNYARMDQLLEEFNEYFDNETRYEGYATNKPEGGDLGSDVAIFSRYGVTSWEIITEVTLDDGKSWDLTHFAGHAVIQIDT